MVEKGSVVLLFILVLIVFSFAQRDSRRLYVLYNGKSAALLKKLGEAPDATFNDKRINFKVIA